MPQYDPVPLPPSTSPKAAVDGVAEWIGSAPMRDLLAEFGGEPPGDDLAADLDYLDDFSARHWDFRGGRERFEFASRSLAEPRERLVRAAAEALGLAGGRAPSRDGYRHIVVFGGLVGSCLFRTRFAAELVADGLGVETVSGLGGFRRFTDRDEHHAELAGFTGGRFEIDAMEEGLRRGFGVTGRPEVVRHGDPDADPNRAWKTVEYADTAPRVRALAAPSSDPDRRRADTADTCRFWAERIAKPTVGDSVLVVTSSLFVPFQYCDALSYFGMPFGCRVDVAGVDTARLAEPHWRTDHTASDYLQEIRSTVRSMRRLLDAAGTAESATRVGEASSTHDN